MGVIDTRVLRLLPLLLRSGSVLFYAVYFVEYEGKKLVDGYKYEFQFPKDCFKTCICVTVMINSTEYGKLYSIKQWK